MSPHSQHHSDQPTLPLESSEEDYEIITSEEVDGILDSLETLIASTTSENIRIYLEEAADQIYALVYSEEEQNADQERDEAA